MPCSPGTVNAGAHNTVDAQRHVGVSSCSSGMGIDGAHNTVDAQGMWGILTVWELMGPTIL